MNDQAHTTSDILPVVPPEEAGLSGERLAHLREMFQREIDAKRMPGCVIGIARGGQIAWLEALGARDPKSGETMTTDTVFSVASMTKLMTSTVIMQLFEEGRLLLGDPVEAFLPQLANLKVAEFASDGSLMTRPAHRQPTVQDLLRHTSGFTYQNRGTTPAHALYPGSSMSASEALKKKEFLETLGACPLLFDPGKKWEYGFSTDVLGHIAEAVEGKPLGVIMSERIWQPLGMADTGFELNENTAHRYAKAFDRDPITGDPQSIAHARGGKRHWQSGGGGCVSTANDYLKFLHMMLSLGEFGDTRVLGRKTVELMTADHLAPDVENRIADTMDPAAEGYGFGLGVAVRRDDGISAMAGTAGDYYWSGVYGTYFWVDPFEELTVVLMAATPGPYRLRMRQLIRAGVYQAIAD
jgi:CubicO group peptidase (beta-lactamase class C family)